MSTTLDNLRLGKRTLHFVRRTHLYLGLFLLPFAVLYGISAFLFNHPSAFSEQPTTTFGRGELAGTPMELPTPPATVAEQVVAALNLRATDGVKCKLVEPEKAKYNREFAFATVKTADEPTSILIEVGGSGGTVRRSPKPPVKASARAPFAVSGTRSGFRTEPPANGSREALTVPDPLHERFQKAIPTILERTGFPAGEATITSVPDLVFRMERDGQIWLVSFNSLNGTVSGQLAAEETPEPISPRRFLTRLHSAHGYPTSGGIRWWWAILVDVMAFVLCFWGLSGLLMWWQVKAARRIGALALALSALVAAALAFGMHAFLSQ